jgi:hypothetical protein
MTGERDVVDMLERERRYSTRSSTRQPDPSDREL